jgi:3-oxoacyl-ACP reductase-like protein
LVRHTIAQHQKQQQPPLPQQTSKQQQPPTAKQPSASATPTTKPPPPATPPTNAAVKPAASSNKPNGDAKAATATATIDAKKLCEQCQSAKATKKVMFTDGVGNRSAQKMCDACALRSTKTPTYTCGICLQRPASV